MQTCEHCGRELHMDGQTKFCPFCGAPVARRNAPPRAAAPMPPAPAAPAANAPDEKEKNQKILYIVLAVAALALLLIVILLAIKVFGGKPIGDPGSDDAVSDAEFLAEKEAAFREALSIVDVSGFPQSSSSGCFETFCGDLSGDGAPEYVAIYGDFSEEQPSVDIRLYDMETDEPQETDRLAEPINAVVGGNGALSICAFIENGRLYVFRSFCAFGGSRWGNEYICFSVQDGKLTEDYHFTEYEFPRYDQFTYEETVSGTTYATSTELQAAAAEKGPAPHSHDMTVDENGNPIEAPTDGHIFVLYHNVNFNESGETGYIRLFRDHPAADAQPTQAPSTDETKIIVDPTQAAAPATTAPASLDADGLWAKLSGIWNLPEKNTHWGSCFLLFDKEDGKNRMQSGVYAGEYDFFGYVETFTGESDQIFTITFYTPPYELASTLIPERRETYSFDITDIGSGHIRVKDEGTWLDCYYGGATVEEGQRDYVERLGDDAPAFLR